MKTPLDPVQRLIDALTELTGVREVEIHSQPLAEFHPSELGGYREHPDAPHALLLRRAPARNEILVTIEMWLEQNYHGWIALEFMAFVVREMSSVGREVLMRPLAYAPWGCGKQLGRTLRLVVEGVLVQELESNEEILSWIEEFASEFEEASKKWEEELSKPTLADPATVPQLLHCARRHDPVAQYVLANLYADGEGVEEDPQQAFLWYRRAAKHQHPDAMLMLGFCYAEAVGVEEDLEKAFRYFRRAAKSDVPLAKEMLGQCYLGGLGVEQDEARGLRWLRRAAKEGEAGAMLQLGECYETGIGVAPDRAQAIEWYRQAASAGHEDADLALRRLLETGDDNPG